ncbi:MAG: hypothetical protein JW732_08820 [Dehalococcoidia bacterium]|nr:hypothetical protein [Dehalococcoidia bacterium]
MERSLEIQLIVYGITLEEPYKGQLFAVKKCKVISSGKSVPDCVQFDYKISVKADPSVCEQHYINRIVPREIDLFLQSLSLLSRCPSHLIRDKATLDGVAVKPVIQQCLPSLYNLAEMFNRGKFTPSGLSISPPRDFWDLLENIIFSYRQRTDDVSRRLALALRWFKKGSDELNNSDRLVAFWISFNALYANIQINNKRRSERESIEKYILSNTDLIMAQRYANNHKKLLNDLSQFPIELKGGRKITQELADLLSSSSQNYIEIGKTTVLTIYGIRNNLFHGDYDPDSEDEQKHIATAEYLLSPLISELIIKEMTGKPLPKTIVFPRILKGLI